MGRGKKVLLLTGALFVALAAAFIILRGSVFTLRLDTGTAAYDAQAYTVTLEQEREIIQLTDKRMEGRVLAVTIKSVSKGRAFLSVVGPDEYAYMTHMYVHSFGVITADSYLGDSSGSGILPVLLLVYTALLLAFVADGFRRDMRRTLYQYRNVRNLGWILFLSLMLVGQLVRFFSGSSIVDSAYNILISAANVAVIAFPFAFALSVLVVVSNVQLIRKEGRNWRNLLGTMLGTLVCFSTVFPSILSEWLQRTTVVDVHNMRGWALYAELAVTNGTLLAVSYLECILWGAVFLGFKAARRIPAFDKDYLLILGCQIGEDGTLTPLLKGRADRALEFATMQKKATGKELVFVPSGGKGDDEIIPEAEAIGNYLVSAGVPQERILVEDRSVNTYENFRNSLELIREHSPEAEPKIAFSTTNYHVLRSGILAEQQGVHAEGIGSKTRRYFWINAFVREFIAALFSEWKKHLKVIAALLLLTCAMVIVVWLSNTI